MSPSKPDAEIHAMQEALSALRGLDQSEKERVLKWLANKLNLSSTLLPGTHSASVGNEAPVGLPKREAATTAKAFVAGKRPTTDVERIACIAYYLTHFRDTPHFNANDLANLNAEAAQPKIGNITRAVNNANLSESVSFLRQDRARNKLLSSARQLWRRFPTEIELRKRWNPIRRLHGGRSNRARLGASPGTRC